MISQLHILNSFYQKIVIPTAVWEEITRDDSTAEFPLIQRYFSEKVVEITGPNNLVFIMDYGESEAVILYQELNADWLLIDDRKARRYAESLGVNCIGALGILLQARISGIIENLRPLFLQLLSKNRYYAISLLNSILDKVGEETI